MLNRTAKLGLLAAATVSIACASGVAAANAEGGVRYLQGADYLTSGGNMADSGPRVASNSFADNGIAGKRSVLDVPEPSSVALFGGALLMITGASFWRRRNKRSDSR